jgi:SAM-dependent methyltransferase
MQAFRPCNACEATGPDLLHVKDRYSIVGCRHCGLVYVGDDLALIDFKAIYAEDYYKNGNDRVFADYLGDEAQRRALARRKLWTLRRLHAGGRLLDVGCAAGFFLAEARTRYTVTGVELSEFSSSFAREHFGLNVHTGSLIDAALPAAEFDLITLWDVIEHLPDPRLVLTEAARVLAPGGHLVLTTGDIGSRYARELGWDWPLIGPPWHLYYFSRQTLSGLALAAGLRAVSCAAHGMVSTDPLMRFRLARAAANLAGAGDIMQMTFVKHGLTP